MLTPKGKEVFVDNLGHLGFIFKCENLSLFVKQEQNQYFLYKENSDRKIKSFDSWYLVVQDALSRFDKMPDQKKESKKKPKTKKS